MFAFDLLDSELPQTRMRGGFRDSADSKGESHIKGACCYSAFSPARLISYPQWPQDVCHTVRLCVCFKRKKNVGAQSGCVQQKSKNTSFTSK